MPSLVGSGAGVKKQRAVWCKEYVMRGRILQYVPYR